MTLAAAYIVPHPPLAIPEVGRGEEQAISKTLIAYKEVARRIAGHHPDIIVFMSPHSAYYKDCIYIGAGKEARGDFSRYGAPHVSFCLRYNSLFREALIEKTEAQGLPIGYGGDGAQELDHGLMVPLSFINAELDANSYQAVSIGGSGLPAFDLIEFGRCIAQVTEASDYSIVLVASGDLSHKLKKEGPYGFDPAGPLFDQRFGEIVQSGNLLDFATIDETLREDAAECGLSGFIMLSGALDEYATSYGNTFGSELLSLEGPFGVGYGVAAFERRPNTVAENHTVSNDPLVKLAYKTIDSYIKTGTRPSPPELPIDLPKEAGCFVSIHTTSTGNLRGCIGTTGPTRETLAEEIIENSIAAAIHDPRFPPIDEEELSDLTINVDVLFPAEPTQVDELDPKRYGIIVSQGLKRGLLLPDLEGVDTVEEQLRIACMKAGIDPDSLFDIERFEVIRHV